ncbi:hypothetical protein KAFR_0J00770 [Kazachstania africana CBS 2517]|uniref:DNA mismatch repair protein MutL n=1 Tax=Kazachstania africana (strain ATCC 22294 / BCRC 22015 / CBS 2517 / CECT 1963 / NBRC 1671 / NRRL Y-8276) TaxID=1071382 RepID=H2B0J5_KAZAF|nr:hypothetical protein KAFR_0J00770 [Kazachstania africana CBS 2517]CCF60145.1 hypothetical protein KAFR_0J00770 [Kazachstania africana CBS 2517]
MLRHITQDDINLITSSQVIIDLATIIKELIDNSIDAGSNSIEIILKDYGVESIEFMDNGSGISQENFENLTKKHYTSKISTFDDISSLKTFGFRGEAISSIVTIAEKFVVVTNEAEGSSKATELDYNNDGKLTSQRVTTRNKGTTFKISKIFYNLPVRRENFIRNIKSQFKSCINLIQSYSIIQENISFKIFNINTKNQKKSLILSTIKSDNLFKKILNCFGLSCTKCLVPLKISLDLNSYKSQFSKTEDDFYESIDYKIELGGYISKINDSNSTRNLKDRQFFYLNKRPVVYPSIQKLITEIFKLNHIGQSNKYPMFFLNLNVNESLIDINITPDKRTIMLSNEDVIMGLLKHELNKFFQIDNDKINLSFNTSSLKRPNDEDSDLQRLSKRSTRHELTYDQEEEESATDMSSFMDKTNDYSSVSNLKSSQFNLDEYSNEHPDVKLPQSPNDNESAEIITVNIDGEEFQHKILEEDDKLVFLQDSDHDTSDKQILRSDNESSDADTDHPIEINVRESFKDSPHRKEREPLNLSSFDENRRITEYYNTELVADEDEIKAESRKFMNLLQDRIEKNDYDDADRSNALNNNVEDEGYLTFSFSKEDFNKLEVIGQFNLGFIVTLKKSSMNKYDMFIIDQHASDEKFNFEKLNKELVLKTQKLIVPIKLELNIVDELIVIENADMFNKNGFKIEINDDNEPGKKVQLLSIPIYKNLTFNVEDFHELVDILKEKNGTSNEDDIKLCSKTYSMLAMKACRSSIMIGKPLTHKTMTRVVKNLNKLQKPWNCPHGRPTMRHLVELNDKNCTSFTNDYKL